MKKIYSNTYIDVNKSKGQTEIVTKDIDSITIDEKTLENTIKEISKLIKRPRFKNELKVKTNLNLDSEYDDSKMQELVACIKACTIKDKYKRLEFIYMATCKYLDTEFRNKNICEFENGMCFYKKEFNEKNGCCYKISFLSLKGKKHLCKYHKGKNCETYCLECKLFVCDKIIKEKGIKFTCRNVLLIKYFFNFWQKIIIKSTAFVSKEKVLKLLKIFS